MNLKAESVDKYFSVLTGSTDVNIQNVDAQRTVEAMLTTCTFFGKNLTVNKYVATKLELIEKEIKDADIDYPIHDI
ncbi:hypothetical protein KKH82_06760 [Patescibacteria group bacterium]|nr:hypothetical protein [Patescibacteria group bacterium]